MDKRCIGYCGVSCIDGTCPKANIDEYAERGYDIIKSCEECIYYEGCKDCYFYDKIDMCENPNILKNYIESENKNE